MLNELSLIVESLERLGTEAPSRHPRMNPMGKNRSLLVVALDNDGKPSHVEVLPGETAANLLRIEHGSQGSSFPGFNVPTPLRRLEETPASELAPVVQELLALGRNKNSSAAAIAEALRDLFSLSKPRSFRDKQNGTEKQSSAEKQFLRSCSELVTELAKMFPADLGDLKNFRTLIQTVLKSNLTLPLFAESVSALLVRGNGDLDRRMVLLFQDILFGTLDWKKRTAGIGSPEYWKEKAKQDKNSNQPVYLDLASPDAGFWRVANAQTSARINEALFKFEPQGDGTAGGDATFGEDAFGVQSVLQDKFPGGPKVAELGNVKLFSLNTSEVQALQRYRLKGSRSFPISSALVQKMSDALLYLASEDKRGITCRAIPSAQPDKRDLLVAYLEGEPEGRAPLAEMFGGEATSFSDADFEAIAKPVLEMLEGKVASNPNLNVRLLSFCPIDKAKKQISINRSLRVRDIIESARTWEDGGRNVPEVSVWFYDKNSKQSVYRAHTTPCPVDLSSVVNRVWSADAKSGFLGSFQRAFSVADAYDVFLVASPLARQKAQIALELLLGRMSNVLAALGAAKVARRWTDLSDAVRWQSVKSIALLGILLHQQHHDKDQYMSETIYNIGRLLALADTLHFQYCKFVRTSEDKRKAGKVGAPSELLGNALFNTALDQPVSALARLAERIKPYKGWADTYSDEDAGLIHWLNRQMAEVRKGINIEKLPPRMSDTDKAKLLLGYLADQSKNETPKQ